MVFYTPITSCPAFTTPTPSSFSLLYGGTYVKSCETPLYVPIPLQNDCSCSTVISSTHNIPSFLITSQCEHNYLHKSEFISPSTPNIFPALPSKNPTMDTLTFTRYPTWSILHGGFTGKSENLPSPGSPTLSFKFVLGGYEIQCDPPSSLCTFPPTQVPPPSPPPATKNLHLDYLNASDSPPYLGEGEHELRRRVGLLDARQHAIELHETQISNSNVPPTSPSSPPPTLLSIPSSTTLFIPSLITILALSVLTILYRCLLTHARIPNWGRNSSIVDIAHVVGHEILFRHSPSPPAEDTIEPTSSQLISKSTFATPAPVKIPNNGRRTPMPILAILTPVGAQRGSSRADSDESDTDR